MADQEVIKHTKKIYKIWTSKEHGIWQKIKEFFVEVFIIVFAVSLSIWLHNRSEHANQQQDVKEFLLGLKSDLKSDLLEMQDDRASYENQRKAFMYLTSVRMNQQLNNDSLRKYDTWINTTTSLNPNNGRFEGFKSSGKITEIENKELQNDIMDFYQEDIVMLHDRTDHYTTVKRKLFDFIQTNRKRLTDSTTNMNIILASDEAQNIEIVLSSPAQVIESYDNCINKASKIISEINSEYNIKG